MAKPFKIQPLAFLPEFFYFVMIWRIYSLYSHEEKMTPLLSENSTGTSAYMLLEIGLRDGRKLRPSPRMEKKLAGPVNR